MTTSCRHCGLPGPEKCWCGEHDDGRTKPSRYDNPEQNVSGGHERFEVPRSGAHMPIDDRPRPSLDSAPGSSAAHRSEKALAMLREHAASLDPDSFVSEVIRVLEGEDEAPTAAKGDS